jgi:hypothetical protein
MNAYRNLILFIIVSAVGILILALYSGLFRSTKVEVKFVEPFVAVYHDEIGEYGETRRIQDSLYNLLWEDGIDNYHTFGIFYDDPGTSEVNKMHSRVGCIIEKAYAGKAERLSDKYHVFTFQRQQCAVVEIPFKNTFSVYAGIYKAYPKLNKYAAENGYKKESIIEIHQIPTKITFAMPLIKK